MLHLHAADCAAPLAERLAAVLEDVPRDPMVREWVAVPSEGMRRWLALELARHLGARAPGVGDGVAANIDFPFPGALRQRVLDAGGADGADPWQIDRLVWSVLERATAVGAPIRYPAARRVADLFDRYHVHRPTMIRAWASGDDVDAAGRTLSGHHRWQPELWRAVRSSIGVASPAERLPELLERLRRDELSIDLPERLALFGLSLLPGGSGFLEVADAVASTRELHLFLLEPSPVLSQRLRAGPARPLPSGGLLRADDAAGAVEGHPLIRSWGRLHRETSILLAGRVTSQEPFADPVATAEGGSTLLSCLRADIAADRAPRGDLRPCDDRSVQFHSCHGATRQVEVLRDSVLHLLAADPALREDDIVVFCPDLERFAPLVNAVLGASVDAAHSDPADAVESAPRLRYRVVDRSVRTMNPVLAALGSMLEVVAGPFETSSVLDLIALGPVRERFHLSDDDVDRIDEWTAATSIRWGVDPHHRARLGVPASITTNTWRAAIERLLLGVAVTDESTTLTVGETVPFDLEGDDAELVGRLAEILWRLGALAEESLSPRPLHEWLELIASYAASLLAVPHAEGWQLESMFRMFVQIAESAEQQGAVNPSVLDFDELRRVIADRVAGSAGRSDFFRGGMTVTSLTPLRWVPFRVVCLVGMDEHALGASAVEGDDLIAAAPVMGDRDPRGELRQSLLEAVASAGETLVVIRDGHDVRTNQEIPAPVAVAELATRSPPCSTLKSGSRRCRRSSMYTRVKPSMSAASPHPHSPPMFAWSFDRAGLAGAHARRRRVQVVSPFMAEPLDPVDTSVIELEDLHRFLRAPVRTFVEDRLGVRLLRAEEPETSALPVALSGLDSWAIGDRLLSVLRGGGDEESWRRVESRLGSLPPGVLGDHCLDRIAVEVTDLIDAAGRLEVRDGRADVIAIDVRLSDGTRVVGTVLDQMEAGGDRGRGPARVAFSRSKPHATVASWLDLVALVVNDPSSSWRSVAVNRPATTPKRPPRAAVVELVPRGTGPGVEATARAALEVAVDCYRRGMVEPIPLFAKFSRRAFETLGRKSATRFGSDDWAIGAAFPGEREERGIDLVFGDLELDELMAIPARAGDPAGPGNRVDRFAHHLWNAIESSVARLDDKADDRNGDAYASSRSASS